MGHTRLGSVPKTKKWRAIVAQVASGGDNAGISVRPLADEVKDVARLTIDATQAGLVRAVDDVGLRYTFYLLTQIVLAAREADWQEQLARTGIVLHEEATLFDLTAEMQGAIDDYVAAHGRPTDISEIAQQAAGEAIATLAGPQAVTLFGSGRDELRIAVRQLSTKKGFAQLGQKFFGCFMTRFLNFYLSRVTAAHTGSQKLPQIDAVSGFNEALQTHCDQSARIVYDFCGEWYSKTEFREGISVRNTSGFMAVALKKLQAELQQQGAEA